MAKYSTSWYMLALGVLNLISKTHLTAQDNGHGYITSSERYFDDFSFIQRELSSGLGFDYVGDNLKFQIKFDPVSLDFGQRPLGIPHVKKVHLFNYDSNKSVDLTSISGTTKDFHSSFFNDKRIPPMGNTSFHVVFLGREEGFRESCLFIHTTIGHFKYNVKGVSTYSPYFLRPFVDIKLPMNASFGPLIYLHNPHTDPIQIQEVYTSGGNFHLELPSGNREGPKKIWEIAPFETKAVIRVKFTAKLEQNHTAYVRIKLNITEEVLVVPLEIEVGQRGGIFSPQGYVDFGIGGSMDEPKTIKLCLHNPFTKPVKIQSVTVKSDAVKVEYVPSVIIPTGKLRGSCADIADLTVDWKKASTHQEFTGKIVVKYRNGKSTSEIPYYLTALEGSLVFDSQATKFFTNDKSKNTIRHFKIKNEFRSAIQILNFTMAEEVRKYFKIRNFKALTLKSQEEAIVFSSELKPDVKLESLQLDSHIRLVSNISIVTIPFLSYGGTLKLYLPFKSRDYSLDVGLISFNTKKEVHFLVLNDNPVNVHLKAIKTSIPLTSTTIVGCGKENAKTALFQSSFDNLHACNKLKPNEYAILKLLVQTANNEGHVWGEIQIETDFESLSIPVQFRVAAGKLEIGLDRLVFDQCFPGKICSHPLKVYSTFNEPMIIKDIISLPPDPRLHSRHTGHISPHATKIVGHLYLNPNIGCGNECYTGLHQDLYNQWLKTLMLPKSVVNFDLNLFNTYYNRFLNVTWNGMKKWQNFTLRLDTSEVRSHTFKTRVEMSWPSLICGNQGNKSIISFPVTQVGNVTYMNITIKNPSSNALAVQIVLDGVYPNIELLYEGLPSASLPQNFSSNSGNFFLVKNGSSSESFAEKMGVKVHTSTLPLILKPRENYTLTVGFLGEKAGEFSSFLFLRNNLTVMEILRLKGRSAETVFTLGNRRSGASQPLTFEFTEKHSKECERDKSVLYKNRNLAIKRSFTAKNSGEIPMLITNFYINDAVCEGYGFKVLNCKPVFLLANVTRKIDIEFTPDFTMAKVVRSLIIESSSNTNINYTLQAVIPPRFISICSDIVPRPLWEWYLCYITAILMALMICSILFIAIFDAEKTKTQMIDIIIASRPTVHQTLDLRSLGQQVREEIKNVKVESAKTDMKVPHSEISKGKNEFELKERKKLVKRNSNDSAEYTEASKKNVEFAKQKMNVIVDKKDKDEEKRSSNKENKKVASRNIKTNKPTEEQTLSQCTESDDVEVQDASQKYSKSNQKRENKVDSISNKTTLEETHTPPQNRIEKKKSPKDTPKCKSENQTNSSRKRSVKEQRERNIPSKKTIERCVKRSPEHQIPVTSVSSSTSRVWTDNKATFSDVVARNDSLSNGNVTNQSSSYIDTSNHTTTTLGPIGSRPVSDYRSNGSNTQSQVVREQQNVTMNNSIGLNQEHQYNSTNATQSWNSSMGTHQDHQYNQFRSNASNSSQQDFGRLWNPNYVNSNTHWGHSSSSSLLGGLSAVGFSSLLSPNTARHESVLDSTASTSNYTQQNPAASTISTSSLWQQWVLPFNLPTRAPPGFQNTHRNAGGTNGNSNPTNAISPFSNHIWRYSEGDS